MTDIEIAQANKMEPVAQIAKKIGIEEGDLDLYGSYKAKLGIKKAMLLASLNA